jgi:hypothetical protein
MSLSSLKYYYCLCSLFTSQYILDSQYIWFVLVTFTYSIYLSFHTKDVLLKDLIWVFSSTADNNLKQFYSRLSFEFSRIVF